MVFIKVTASKFTNLKDKTMRKSVILVTTFIKVIKCSGKTSMPEPATTRVTLFRWTINFKEIIKP